MHHQMPSNLSKIYLNSIDTSPSSSDDTYPKCLPSTSKYWFKKIASKVFGRDPWRSNEQRSEQVVTESDTLPDLMATYVEQTTFQSSQQDDMITLSMNVTQPSSNPNPVPINIVPQSDLNVLEEEIVPTSTNFRTEILSGVNSHNKKLYDYKVKLKTLVSKIEKLSMSTYTVLEDSKSSKENQIYCNELKDTGNYMIQIGKQFIDRATAMEIVSSTCPQSEQIEPSSEEDDVIYVSTE